MLRVEIVLRSVWYIGHFKPYSRLYPTPIEIHLWASSYLISLRRIFNTPD